MKKLIATAIASIGIAASAPASAIVIGGIDFGNLPGLGHFETATLAETYVGAQGDVLQAYGVISTVNGDSNYCADGTSNCALYYYLSGYTASNVTGTQVQFLGGTVDIYYSNAAQINLLSQTSPANIATIQSFTPWLQLTGHQFMDPSFSNPAPQTLNGNQTFTGATLSVNGAGQLDVFNGWGLPDVEFALDTDTISDLMGGFSDIVLTASSNTNYLNPQDVLSSLAMSCQTGAPVSGEWCLAGTANMRGEFVPEPGSLALLGLGLAGLGFRARRKTKQ